MTWGLHALLVAAAIGAAGSPGAAGAAQDAQGAASQNTQAAEPQDAPGAEPQDAQGVQPAPSPTTPPAGSAPPAAPATTPTPAPPPPAGHPAPIVDPDIAPGVPRDANGWMDASHEQVERGINALVMRLDRFFGDPSHRPYEKPTTHIQLRNEVRTAQDDSLDGRVRVGMDLRLPSADRFASRFSVFIFGETEPPPAAPTSPDAAPDQPRPRFQGGLRAASGGLELRYDLFRATHTLVDAGAGVRFDLPPPPFTRVRLAQRFPLGIRIVGHLNQALYWDLDNGFGEDTRLDVERAFGPRTLARWWSHGTVDERSRGYEWQTELGLQRILGSRTALYSAGAIAGATRAAGRVENYRLFTRVRRDVHRGWAFVEVEPDISWPADAATGHRSRVLGLTLRLELLFDSDGFSPTPLGHKPTDARSPAVVSPAMRAHPGA